MKKRFHSLLSIFFLLSLMSFPEREAFSEEGKSFLWKVESGASTVYILGSIHFLKKENYPLSQKIESAFEKSDILVVEANVQDQGKMNTQAIMEKALYPPNESIADHLSRESYEFLKGEASKLGLPLEVIDKQRPWFLSIVLDAMELMKLGYDPSYGVDNYFLSKATGRKRILELESLDEQLHLLSNLSEKDQELLLTLSLKDLQNADQEANKLVQAWKTGDTSGMEAVITKSLREDPKLVPIYGKLIYERNRRMVSKIEGYLKGNGTYFVVVGAGHLIGEKGIVETLGKKGFRVEQF
jgi:hypothetical protein